MFLDILYLSILIIYPLLLITILNRETAALQKPTQTLIAKMLNSIYFSLAGRLYMITIQMMIRK